VIVFGIGERKFGVTALHDFGKHVEGISAQRIGWKDWDGDDAGLEASEKGNNKVQRGGIDENGSLLKKRKKRKEKKSKQAK
jgi:hypothetical protein